MSDPPAPPKKVVWFMRLHDGAGKSMMASYGTLMELTLLLLEGGAGRFLRLNYKCTIQNASPCNYLFNR